MGLRILIVGARGLVGQGALKVALNAQPSIERVGLLLRQEVTGLNPENEAPENTKTGQLRPAVQTWVIPAFTPEALLALDLSGFDACWYGAGTLPMGQSSAKYRAVTVDVTVNVAKAFAAANPGARFLYVSGLGANAASPLMPMRVKGEAEEALQSLNLQVCSLRPGVVQPVQGVRSMHPLRDVLYRAVGPVMNLASPFLKGQFTTTELLGRAMLKLSQPERPLPLVLENRQINDLGKI
jgi:uncharacterized protein YbjT (DUF2867 family)